MGDWVDNTPTLLGAVWHTLAIYAFLILGLSRITRRQMAQFTILDYLIIALLGSAVETTLYAGSTSVAAGLLSAATLLLANRALSFMVNHSTLFRRFLIGTPVVLVHDGQLLPSHLRHAHLTKEDVMAAIRIRGYDSLDQVRFAILEVNGSIGVVPKESQEQKGG